MNEDGVAEGHSQRPNEQTVDAILFEKYEAHHPPPRLHAYMHALI